VSSRCWKLNPSDLAFLWEECPRCFYLEVVRGFPRPATPKVFTPIDEQMRACCEGRRTETLAPDMPGGVFEVGERRVASQPIDVYLPDAVHRCLISGGFDTVVRLDDGGYAVVDFKTSKRRRTDHVPLYARQLHAYAYALEHPAPGALALGPVTRPGGAPLCGWCVYRDASRRTGL
jgi:hypothetical protein